MGLTKVYRFRPRCHWYGRKNKQNHLLAGLVLILLSTSPIYSLYISVANQAQYLYNELGRLVGVADSTGITAVYNYDAVGNLTSIDRFTPPGSGIGIYVLLPAKGAVGAQVKIQGYGFDPLVRSS